MAIYKVSGLVVGRRDFGEADRIVTLITGKFGKMSVLAKGARRPTSKLAPVCDLYVEGIFTIAEAKIHIVTEAVIKERYTAIRRSLAKMAMAQAVAERISLICSENIAQFGEEKLLSRVLKFIAENKIELNHYLVESVTLKALVLEGFTPGLYKCIACNGKLDEDNLYFSFEGGVVCAEHNKNTDAKIDGRYIKIMRLLLTMPFNRLVNLPKLNKTEEKMFSGLIRNLFTYHAHKEPKAHKFIEQLSGR